MVSDGKTERQRKKQNQTEALVARQVVFCSVSKQDRKDKRYQLEINISAINGALINSACLASPWHNSKQHEGMSGSSVGSDSFSWSEHG